MIPDFDVTGNLPPGIHSSDWDEFSIRFGATSRRQQLLQGLQRGLLSLRVAGCSTAYVDGSFVTDKENMLSEAPGDFDVCWDTAGVDPTLLDAVLLQFDQGRAAQKMAFGGEFFPAHFKADRWGRTFFDFFQQDKNTGEPKGIIALNLRSLP